MTGFQYRVDNPRHARARNLLPRWQGWIALNYGPKAQYQIPRQAPLAWHMEARAFWKSFRRPYWNAARRTP